MNYKEKYKEIIEKIKEAKESMGGCTFSSVVDKIIPELKESEDEDEKIRKTLIHIVKGACDNYGIKYRGVEITEEKLLAWLEKH